LHNVAKLHQVAKKVEATHAGKSLSAQAAKCLVDQSDSNDKNGDAGYGQNRVSKNSWKKYKIFS